MSDRFSGPWRCPAVRSGAGPRLSGVQPETPSAARAGVVPPAAGLVRPRPAESSPASAASTRGVPLTGAAPSSRLLLDVRAAVASWSVVVRSDVCWRARGRRPALLERVHAAVQLVDCREPSCCSAVFSHVLDGGPVELREVVEVGSSSTCCLEVVDPAVQVALHARQVWRRRRLGAPVLSSLVRLDQRDHGDRRGGHRPHPATTSQRRRLAEVAAVAGRSSSA